MGASLAFAYGTTLATGGGTSGYAFVSAAIRTYASATDGRSTDSAVPLDAFALASFTVASAPTFASAYSVTYATYYAAAGESARYESITGGCQTET